MSRKHNIGFKVNPIFLSDCHFLVQNNIQTLVIHKTSQMDAFILILMQRKQILMQLFIFLGIEQRIHAKQVRLIVMAEFSQRFHHIQLLHQILILYLGLWNLSADNPVFLPCHAEIFYEQQQKYRQYDKKNQCDQPYNISVHSAWNFKNHKQKISKNRHA